MIQSVEVTYRGVEVTVEGEYTPHRKARIAADPEASSPEEGGCFEDYIVKVGDVDITDLIDAVALTEIGDLAAVESGEGQSQNEGSDK